jgi:hypothetical protein
MMESHAPISSGRLVLAVLALFGGMPVLVWFSWLRETHLFWMNAGGYPVWLRELVLGAYHPLLLASIGGTGLYFLLLLVQPPRSRRLLYLEFALFALMVTAIAIAVAIDLLKPHDWVALPCGGTVASRIIRPA